MLIVFFKFFFQTNKQIRNNDLDSISSTISYLNITIKICIQNNFYYEKDCITISST